MENMIIFGAGKAAAKQRDWAIFAGYQVLFFVDNDSDKWGKTIDDVPIHSPASLQGYCCPIAFSDSYGEEILAQLEGMRYPGRKIKFSQLKKEAVCQKDINIAFPEAERCSGGGCRFVFDAYFPGLNWGGVESWSCTVSSGLSDLGARTCLICGSNPRFDDYADNCCHFHDENEVELVKKMAAKIAGCLPCAFISHASIALYAARIVKSAFPDQIRLVVVAHGDEDNTYRTLGFWSDQVDRIVCISKKIYDEFQMRYALGEDILLYRPNPVKVPMPSDKGGDGTNALRIGFAARLRKEQKRAHLLPQIIEACMGRGLDVEFNIAGEGECQEPLLAYVSDRHLEDRVHILGWIPPADMADFWRNQDIYLNIFDFEGMSLAMLEAMSQGCVPVATDVSGAGDLIEDGENGFVLPIEDWLGAVDKIEDIARDRGWLQKAATYNRGLIKERCDICDYAKWMLETFRFGEKALCQNQQ